MRFAGNILFPEFVLVSHPYSYDKINCWFTAQTALKKDRLLISPLLYAFKRKFLQWHTIVFEIRNLLGG